MPDFQIHQEGSFEDAIFQHLNASGWLARTSANFDPETALDKKGVLHFIKTSQKTSWSKMTKFYGDASERQFISRLQKELELRGMLDCLRHGITDSGIKFQLAYFKPDSSLNPDTIERYNLNQFYITRQVYFSRESNKSVDLLLSINGLPIATLELKNHLTGQTVSDAIKQYRTDRDPNEKLFRFKERAVVHFAVDSDEVYFTTKIDRDKTRFFPFNKGNGNGTGNPPDESGEYKTSYFWKEILQPDSFMEIVGRFLHLQVDEFRVDGTRHTRETLIFPRYHQLDAVRRLAVDALTEGTGNNYLIQHSAGSGKSNSIAWLAYRLSSLYDGDNRRVFDSVVVVTDRMVLDTQLQNTIYQFDHKQGVVKKIDDNSKQLAQALTHGTNIIITTLQKFPFALNHLADLPDRRYAVIIDEAHSSQGGNASRRMNEALAAQNVSLEEAEKIEGEIEAAAQDSDDYIRETIRKQGMQPNVSTFAFTATPKPKTLEVFGIKGAQGKPRPFHLYSMRQAIEEGFILDVLKNYVSYKHFYRLSKAIEEDPELSREKAVKAIGRFVSIHPHIIAQKTEVMIEHFRQITMRKVGGRAKAMVVTSSRKHAVRYFEEFKRYIREKGYLDITPVVAFSGTVIDDAYPDGITEVALNGFGEKELPDKFDSFDHPILLVADKYQTGFDQPFLHTMYVDKKLSGVRAVQTLSRLNRIASGKEDTFILDFANDRDEIVSSFQPYYEVTTMDETADPNHLYDLKNDMDRADVYRWPEINEFAKVFYKPAKNGNSAKEQGWLYGFLDAAIERYKTKNEEEKDEFKNSMTAYVNLYSFLSQIMPFQDVELEKLYSYGRFLIPRLPKIDLSERLKLDNEVEMQYYRLQKIADGDLVLQIQGEASLRPTTGAGIKLSEEEIERLSSIITNLNDKYGTEFNEADKLFFDQIEEELFLDEELRNFAITNSPEAFAYPFDDIFTDKVIERMGDNQIIFDKIMTDSEFNSDVRRWLRKKVYKRLRNPQTEPA